MIHRKHPQEARTIDMIVEEKMQVLTDFCIVDQWNYDDIERDLICAIHKQSTSDPDAVADRFAKDLISKKLH